MLIYSPKSYIGAELSFLSSASITAPDEVVIYHYPKCNTWLVDLRSRILPLSILRGHGVTFSTYVTEPL